MSPSREIAVLAGRVGAARQHALHDPVVTTAAARKAFADSFLMGHQCAVCPPIAIPADLPMEERQRRAEHLRKAHMTAITLHRHRQRRAAKQVAVDGAS